MTTSKTTLILIAYFSKNFVYFIRQDKCLKWSLWRSRRSELILVINYAYFFNSLLQKRSVRSIIKLH